MSTTKTSARIPSWKKQGRAWHTVTPPSGMTGMRLRIPSLSDLIRNEAIPDRLRAFVLKSTAHPAGIRGVVADQLNIANGNDGDDAEKTTERLSDEQLLEENSDLRAAVNDWAEIQKHLICESVQVDGDFLTMDDLADPEFPAPDKEWLGLVMLREVEYDARGVRLGIEPLDVWKSFRDFHDCGPACGACAALQDAFSSVDLGGV